MHHHHGRLVTHSHGSFVNEMMKPKDLISTYNFLILFRDVMQW